MRSLVILGIAGTLHACTLVDGDRILAQDFAAEHAAFVKIPAGTDFGPAPVAGARRSFRYFEIEKLAREHEVVLAPADARDACFERSTDRLDPEVLRSTLSSILNSSDLEVLDLSRNSLPRGKPEFRAEGLSSTGLWHGRWLYGENRSVPLWVRVKSSTIGRPTTSLKRDVGRGDTVRVEIRSGGVLLEFDAVTESSGHIGEPVTVKNPVNGQRFRAIVHGPGKVIVRK